RSEGRAGAPRVNPQPGGQRGACGSHASTPGAKANRSALAHLHLRARDRTVAQGQYAPGQALPVGRAAVDAVEVGVGAAVVPKAAEEALRAVDARRVMVGILGRELHAIVIVERIARIAGVAGGG